MFTNLKNYENTKYTSRCIEKMKNKKQVLNCANIKYTYIMKYVVLEISFTIHVSHHVYFDNKIWSVLLEKQRVGSAASRQCASS